MITYATVCSGVEGCSLALDGMGWQPVFFSEIEPFPCAVLKYHYPSVPNLGDISKISYDNEKGIISNGTVNIRFRGRLGVLAGGTPCTSFSVAGKREGGAKGSGTESSLCWEFLRLVREFRPRVLLWENVVGCLSTNEGRDFREFVREIDALGYCVAWRVLDAQYVRVDKFPSAIPQRRRRVWLVGCTGADVSGVAKILFEPTSLTGDTPPSRIKREETSTSPQNGNRSDAPMVEGSVGSKTCSTGQDVASTLSADDCTHSGQDYRSNSVIETYSIPSMNSNVMKSANPKTGVRQVDVASTLDTTMPTPQKNQGGDMIVECLEHNEQDSRMKPIEDTSPTPRATASNNSLIVEGVDGYNFLQTGDASSTIRGTACDFQHTNGIIVKNSNGGDVMPTINANESKQGGDNQHINGGGYVVHELFDPSSKANEWTL